MIRKILSIALILTLLVHHVPVVQAATLQDCKVSLVNTFKDIVGVEQNDPEETLRGYLKQLSDMTSTNLPTHQLITQVQQLIRDARLELTGVCLQVELGAQMDPYYVAAYDLAQCRDFARDNTDLQLSASSITFCRDAVDERIDALLNHLQGYLLRQALRTSLEPLVTRLRGLNGRLLGLVSEYSRVVNNFFKFSFRLGDAITGDWD